MKKRIVLVIVAVILLLLEVAFVIYQKSGANFMTPETEAGAAHEETTAVTDSAEQLQPETTEATESPDELPLMPFFPDGETAAPPQPQETEKATQAAPEEQPAATEAAPEEQPAATDALDGAGERDENELPRMPF